MPGRKTVYARIRPELWEALHQACEERSQSTVLVLEEALEQFFGVEPRADTRAAS